MKLAKIHNIFVFNIIMRAQISLFATCYSLVYMLSDGTCFLGLQYYWAQHLSAIFAMLPMSHHALGIDHLQGGILLQWTLLNYANKTKLEVTVQFLVLWSFIWYPLWKSAVKFSRSILDWKWEMKVWIIRWYATLVLFSAILSFCHAANPRILLVTVANLFVFPLQKFYSV